MSNQPNGQENCWLWPRHINYAGYPIHRGKRAHRTIYELLRKPIENELDHLCRNRSCVNPWHLEDVTHKTNMDRSETPFGRNARATQCALGHQFAVVKWGKRTRRCCMVCHALTRKQRYEKRGE